MCREACDCQCDPFILLRLAQMLAMRWAAPQNRHRRIYHPYDSSPDKETDVPKHVSVDVAAIFVRIWVLFYGRGGGDAEG